VTCAGRTCLPPLAETAAAAAAVVVVGLACALHAQGAPRGLSMAVPAVAVAPDQVCVQALMT
jgi:hypothetical protein